MTVAILVDPQAPERLRIRISNPTGSAEPLDLSTVSAAELKARHPTAGEQLWSADILTQSADLLLLEHVWALGEASNAGFYRVDILLTVPGGKRRAGPVFVPVTA